MLFLLFIVAIIGGAINSVAGGGTFLTFPILLMNGLPPIIANATNTIALWPGTIASAYAYRNYFYSSKKELLKLGGVSLIGGIIGSILLLMTPEKRFEVMIPYLLLVASIIFTFGKKFISIINKDISEHGAAKYYKAAIVIQLLVAVYGGFFGAGIGILMLAMLILMGMDNIHQMNGLKSFLAFIVNGVSVLIFIIADIIEWKSAVVMIIGAAIGGFLGAHYAQKTSPQAIRAAVIIIAWSMTFYFFIN